MLSTTTQKLDSYSSNTVHWPVRYVNLFHDNQHRVKKYLCLIKHVHNINDCLTQTTSLTCSLLYSLTPQLWQVHYYTVSFIISHPSGLWQSSFYFNKDVHGTDQLFDMEEFCHPVLSVNESLPAAGPRLRAGTDRNLSLLLVLVHQRSQDVLSVDQGMRDEPVWQRKIQRVM